MPAVKPPEWDAMSAKEQLLWYLERLCAQADEMSSVLGIARVGDPPVVTSLVDPAASTTTDASPTPVPDVSGSTTKAQEVLEVIHDAPPACIAMAHITCSTDGSNQVVATNSVDKVTTVYHESDVDLSDKFGALTIPVMASINPPLHVQVPSRKSFARSTRGVALAGPDEYTLVVATPDVAPELAVLSSVSFPTNKVYEVLVVSRRASPVYIGMAPISCSTKCSNQVGATSFPSPVTTASLLPAATHELVADLVCPATKAVNSMQPFQKHDLDISPHTSHQGLLLRPMPWPSLRATRIAEGMETRPIPWPSFAVSVPSEVCHSGVAHWNFSVTTSVHGLHTWTFRAHPFQFAQVLDMGLTSSSFPMESGHVEDLVGNHRRHCIQKNFSGDLKLPRESWRYLQIVQPKTCQPEQEWRLSISTKLQGYDIPGVDRELQTKAEPLSEFSQETTQLKHPWPSFGCLQVGGHLKYAGPPLQVTYVMKHFSGDLNFSRESWSYLQIVQQKPCQSAKFVCWIPMVPGKIPTRVSR
ncbi:hypothetical protein ACQJBY_064645 [Aegilops geniculata]